MKTSRVTWPPGPPSKTSSIARLSTRLPHAAMPPRPPAHEPDERDDPLNAALDAAEQLVRNIVANGGEAPLRARLARLLPPGAGEGSR